MDHSLQPDKPINRMSNQAAHPRSVKHLSSRLCRNPGAAPGWPGRSTALGAHRPIGFEQKITKATKRRGKALLRYLRFLLLEFPFPVCAHGCDGDAILFFDTSGLSGWHPRCGLWFHREIGHHHQVEPVSPPKERSAPQRPPRLPSNGLSSVTFCVR
jgi:hypothetical protein